MANPVMAGAMPKCFGTEYFGKWGTSGMRLEDMKIDKPEQQIKCAECPFFERCASVVNVKILRIKR